MKTVKFWISNMIAVQTTITNDQTLDEACINLFDDSLTK